MINHKDISVVIQGELTPLAYEQTSRNIRKLLPSAEIVLATYRGSNTNGLDYDKLAMVNDVGGFPSSDKPNAKTNNINRQIQTTLAGLKLATRKYAFKIRSDFVIDGTNFLYYFDEFSKSEKNFKIFENKILACVFFSRNPRSIKYSMPFHPSDIAFFGLRSDLLNLFDIPFMPKEEILYYQFKKTTYCRYVPEQHLWISCLRKNGKHIQCDHAWHCNAQLADETERFAASNFIYLDYNQFSLVPPDKLRMFSENDFESIVTHVEWQQLYKNHVDNSHLVPVYDPMRFKIHRKVITMKLLVPIARYLTFLIPLGLVRRSLRKKLITAMTKNIRL